MIRIIEKPFNERSEFLRMIIPNSNAHWKATDGIDLNNICKSPYITDNTNYTRTLAGFGTELREDFENRSSWTHNNMFADPYTYTQLKFSPEAIDFWHNNFIKTAPDECCNWNLLKYEQGDFFKKHVDTKIDETHRYTCLLFCPCEDKYEGGDIIFTNKEMTFCSTIQPSKFKEVTMVIFTIDLYHEITPITSGKRYVFKKPLFVTREMPTPIDFAKVDRDIEELGKPEEVDELCDGGLFDRIRQHKSSDY